MITYDLAWRIYCCINTFLSKINDIITYIIVCVNMVAFLYIFVDSLNLVLNML